MHPSEYIAEKVDSIELPVSPNIEETLGHLYALFPQIKQLFEEKDEKGFIPSEEYAQIEDNIVENLPEDGNDLESLLEEIRQRFVPHFNYENTKFFGYIPLSPTNVSMLADSLTPFFSQYLGAVVGSPGANAVESLVIKWIGEIMGYSGDFFGSFTMGGSHANLQGIFTGLVNTIPWDSRELGMIGDKRPVIYTSDQAHLCISKSIHQVGLGSKSLKTIPSNEKLQLSLDLLKEEIVKDSQNPDLLPVMIVASAGTTNTGAIDDLRSLKELADKYGLWLHVDAAYGGFARLADHEVAKQLEDLPLADSIATDTHKWFYTPLEGGLTLVKQEKHLKKAYAGKAEYLEDSEIENNYSLLKNFSEYGFALSRRWRGLMVWMNCKYYGTKGLGRMITRNILLADYFRAKIKEDEEFELFMHSQLGNVCFRHPNPAINTHVFETIMNEGSFLLGRTTIHGQKTLRISVLSEKMGISHIDAIFNKLKNALDSYNPSDN